MTVCDLFLKFTSGVTPAELLMVTIAPDQLT